MFEVAPVLNAMKEIPGPVGADSVDPVLLVQGWLNKTHPFEVYRWMNFHKSTELSLQSSDRMLMSL